MRPFVENFPFFSIFLALLAGIVTATIRSGRITYRITVAVCAASAVLNACVLWYTFQGDLSFTYTMGRFLAPYGNAIKCGPLQALLSTVFSLVMAAALAGGKRDLFQDVLPEQQQPVGNAQLLGLFPQNGQHLLRLVHPDHVVARLGEHQRQIAGAAAQVRHNAIVHAVGVHLLFYISIQRIIVRLAVQLVVKVGEFIVSHYAFTPRPRAGRRIQPAVPRCQGLFRCW